MLHCEEKKKINAAPRGIIARNAGLIGHNEIKA